MGAFWASVFSFPISSLSWDVMGTCPGDSAVVKVNARTDSAR